VLTPHRRLNVNPRIDYAINANNTITGRYGYLESSNTDSGVGDFNLLSRGINTSLREHTVQITETAVLSPKAINEIRFQYLHINNTSASDLSAPPLNQYTQILGSPLASLSVAGSFNGGGAQVGNSYTMSNHIEFTDILSMTHGTHAFKLGGRVRTVNNDDNSPANYGGTYTFGGGQGVQLDANNQIIRDASGNPVIGQVSSIERYRRTLLFMQQGKTPAEIRVLGGGPTQFQIAGGIPLANVSQVDLGVFAQDDWRLKQNFTLSLGLRYETQTNIHDWTDIAPRLGFAYAPGSKGSKPGKTVIRGGFGMFYDRVSESLTLSTIRNNGILQQQYTITNPDFFPSIPTASSLQTQAVGQNLRKFENDLRAPYIMQTAIGVERQLPKNTTLAVTYTRSHALHMLRSRNISAPLPGSEIIRLLPGQLPTTNSIYEYESNGRLNQNQMIVNLNSRINPKISLFTYYVLNSAKSDTDGANSFPANQYDTSTEYGRASIDVRNRFVLGGSIVAPYNLRFSPFIIASSGQPFNITTGQDNNGDLQYTDRPSLATAATINPIVTRFGTFDANPAPGAVIIPRNYAEGPGQFTVNLRVGRTWGFGERATGPTGGSGGGDGGGGGRGGGGGGRGGPGGGGGGMRMGGGMRGGGMDGGGGNTGKRYNVTLSVQARNLFNHTNLGPPIGILSSPLFGTSNSIASGGFGGGGAGGGGGGGAANNRRIDLQLRFTF
jgi:hypothetical protein